MVVDIGLLLCWVECRDRDDDHHAADPAVGREAFGPVDHPALPLTDRGRAHAGRVAASAGLGQPPRSQHLATRKARQKLRLLRVAAEHRDV